MQRLTKHLVLITLALALTAGVSRSAQFGSVKIQSPQEPAGSESVQPAAQPAPPQVRVEATQPAPAAPAQPAVTAPAATTVSAPPAASAAPATPSTHKWVQDAQGNNYRVSVNAALPTGWKQIPAPALPPAPSLAPAPAPAPAPVVTQPALTTTPPTTLQPPLTSVPSASSQTSGTFSGEPAARSGAYQIPQTYQSAPQANQVAIPQPQGYPAPQQQPPAYNLPQQVAQPAAPAGTGVPPGKKRLRHKMGYTVIVDKNTTPGPEFTEIEPTPPAPAAATQPYVPPQQYAVPQQQPAYAPQQPAYQPQAAPNPYQTQTYQQAPAQQPYTPAQTYNAQPALSHVPPTWNQQLPYQPNSPQYGAQQAPGQVLPYQQQRPPGPAPIVRSTPPGKKWAVGPQGMRYLVNQSTIIQPPMRELTEEELNRPVTMMSPQQQQQMMMQQQQQQQQQGGSFLGRMMNRVRGGQ